ncbi:MAG: hypothetical protein SO046_02345 [Actinomyces urogenitalis]|uniref:hypothetical protein n=1 Tax=Actinomyces urogenitalis TaxID=103621 RepID=UPI002A7ECB4E|nr:hypothetical protein [Actinomyces urogenitalis]MDY3678046.1 hypothetical protein [Actinomyces urogenitalis]
MRRAMMLSGLLRAEFARSRSTLTWRGPFAVLLASAYALWMGLSTSLAPGWNSGVMAWLGFYPTAFALPLGALVGAAAHSREQQWREGGTAWRATSPTVIRLARVVVLSVSAAWSQVVLLLPILAVGLARGQGPGPWPAMLGLGAVMWVSVSGASCVGVLAARLVGRAALGLAPAAALAWSVLGALDAEAADWMSRPWTWFMRPTLPLLGIHANNVALEADSPLWQEAIWPAVCLSALATVAAMVGAVAPLRRFTGSRRVVRAAAATGTSAPTPVRGTVTTAMPAALAAPRDRPRLMAALALTLPWRLWTALAAALVALQALLHAVYPVTYPMALLTLAGAPVAAVVVGIVTWAVSSPAWRLAILRAAPFRLTLALAVHMVLFLLPVEIAAWLVSGGPVHETGADGSVLVSVYVMIVLPAVTFMLASLTYLVASQAGVGPAVVVAVAMLVVGVMVCGNTVFTESAMWWTGPWGWAWVAATYPQRWLAIGAVSTTVGAAALGTAACLSRRAATRVGE